MDKSDFAPKWYIDKGIRKLKIYYIIIINLLAVILLVSFYVNKSLSENTNKYVRNEKIDEYSEVIEKNNMIKSKNGKKINNLLRSIEVGENYEIVNLNIEENAVYIQFNVKDIYKIKSLNLELEKNFNDTEIKVTNLGDSYSLDFYGGGF